MIKTYRGKNHDWEDGEFTSEGREYDHKCRKCKILCRVEEGKFAVYNRTDFDDCNMRIVKEVMTS